ncbi:hypothetical protein [Corynebacterium sp. Marseille-P4321]|nr:hypothetical protein [Corynebacterium sp. Marseille-P4321]
MPLPPTWRRGHFADLRSPTQLGVSAGGAVATGFGWWYSNGGQLPF